MYNRYKLTSKVNWYKYMRHKYIRVYSVKATLMLYLYLYRMYLHLLYSYLPSIIFKYPLTVYFVCFWCENISIYYDSRYTVYLLKLYINGNVFQKYFSKICISVQLLNSPEIFLLFLLPLGNFRIIA